MKVLPLHIKLAVPKVVLILLIFTSNLANAQTENQPIILTPLNNQVISSDAELRSTIFSWTTTSDEFAYYQIAVYPVFPCQDPLTAFRVNHPIFTQFTNDAFLYLSDNIEMLDGKYVWSVTSSNSSYGSTWSPPSVFEVSTGSGLFIDVTNPCDTPAGCLQIEKEIEKDNPIGVSISIASPEIFLYPRALPMRAEGSDFDKVTFTCKGCEANDGKEIKIYQDIVASYDWELIGKGSLGDPFKAKKLDSLDKELAKLNAEISDLSKIIKDKQHEVDSGIDQQKAENEKRIDDLNKELNAIDSTKSKLTEKRDSLNTEKSKLQNKLSRERKTLSTKLDSIKLLQERIDTLNALLSDKFTDTEIAILSEVEQLLKTKETTEEELLNAEEEFENDLESLGNSIESAEEAVESANSEYLAVSGQIESISEKINGLNSQLLSNPLLFEYRVHRDAWSLKAKLFNDKYTVDDFSDLYLEVFKYAENVSKSTSNRASDLASFQQSLAKLNSAIDKAKRKSSSANATEAYNIYLSSSSRFKVSVDTLSKSGASLDPSILQKIETEQDKIATLESQLRSAELKLESVIAAYEESVLAYENRINEYNQNYTRLVKKLNENKKLIEAKQAQFNKMVSTRRAETSKNWNEYTEEVSDKELLKLDLELKSLDVFEKISKLQKDSSELSQQLDFIKSDISDLDREKEKIEKEIKKLEDRNSELDKRKEKLKKELEKDKKKLEDLIAKRNELLAKLEAASAATKTGSGVYVYYIPPTIDELLKGSPDEAEFKRLVIAVEDRKDSLKNAYQEKEGLQLLFSKLTVNVAKELIKLKEIEESTKKVEAEKKKADDKASDQKFESGKKLKAAREAEKKTKEELDKKKQELAEQKKDLESELKDAESELKSHKEVMAKNDTLLSDLLKEYKQISDEVKELQLDENQRVSNINDNTSKLREHKLKETSLRKEIGRASNDLSRASAKDDIAGIAQYRKELNRLESELKENKKQVDFYVTELGIMAGKLKEIKDKISAKNKELAKISTKYETVSSIQRERKKTLFELEDKVSKSSADLLQVKKDEKKIARLKDSVSTENIDSLLQKDEAYVAAQKEAKELADKLKKLEKDKEKSEANIKTDLEEKAEAEKRVKKAIKDAQDALKLAQDSLQEFIDKYFDEVSFTAKIKITADDAVVDHWREDDDPKVEVLNLTYKNRAASIDGGSAGAKGSEDNEKSKCNPVLEFDEMNPPVFAGISVGKEPRTIAMMYDDGRLLAKQWPVIPDSVGLLAKEVVVATVTASADLDEYKYQCLSDGETLEEKAYRLDSEGEMSSEAESTGSDGGNTTGNEAPSGGNTGSEVGDNTTRERGREGDGSRTRDNGDGSETTDGGEEEIPEEEEDFCVSIAGLTDSIVDIGTYTFMATKTIGPVSSNKVNKFLWEPQEVPKDKKSNEQELNAKYDADVIYEDEEAKGKKIETVLAGVMIETSKSIKGSAGGKAKIVTRVVQGNHKGLESEDIHLEVKLLAGDATEYGFTEAGEITADKKTDGDGYLEETFFYFGKGYGKFEITVEWKRGGSVISSQKIDLESPLIHQYRMMAYQINKSSIDAALKMMKSGGGVEAALASVETKDKENYLIFGTQNHDKGFANDIELKFKSEGKAKVDPASAKTAEFGIAYTALKDAPDNEQIEVSSTAPEKYKELAEDYEAKGSIDTDKIKEFKIGKGESLFVINLNNEVSPGETITADATLQIDDNGGNLELINKLKQLELKVEGVKVEKQGDDYIATEGKVYYESEKGIKINVLSAFDLVISTFGVTCSSGATISGTVKHKKLDDPVKFSAELEPDGNFIGEISDLPEIEVKEFKLKKGSSIIIDMDNDRKKDKIAYVGSFYGIIIKQAELELPKSFNREGVKDPSTISVEDFYISKEGFGGSIETKGQLLSMGFSGYELRVNEVSVKFDRSELKKGSFAGEMILPSPMEGAVGIGISASESKFAAELKTDKPILLPQFKTTFVLKEAGLEYDFEKEIGTLKLSAKINSTKFGDIDIKGFQLKSNGEVEAESISVEKDVTIGGGFTMNLKTIGFKFKDRNDYAMNFDGKVDFKGILAIDATANIKTGPVLTFDTLNIDFDKGPVNFKGEFTYAKSVFEGGFDVGIKKFNKGIKGYVIVGNQQVSPEVSFGYWYGELTVSGAIPIAQTGFSLLEFGGGVGYNFVPPIGDAKGSPLQDGGFSLKALVGVGNAPGGEIIAGRMEMSYISGNFSLFGKAWALTKEESLYGQGQINIRYKNSSPEVDGYIAAYIGLTDAEGKLFLAKGKVNFSYPPNRSRYVWTENVKASLFETINADASLVISETTIEMKGRMYYDVNKEQSLGFGTLKASFDLDANLDLKYVYKTTTGTAVPSLAGNWDVNVEAFEKSFDVMSGRVVIEKALLSIDPNKFTISGTATASYSVLWYSGSKSVAIDYSTNI